jgi:hypothetical protein
LHISPAPTYRDATAALGIEMARRREHGTFVEVEGDQIHNVDRKRGAGSFQSTPSAPEILLAAASARVGSTSSASTTPPIASGRRQPPLRHSASSRTASTLRPVTSLATSSGTLKIRDGEARVVAAAARPVALR